MNKRNKQWDKFIHGLLTCMITAQRKYQYFIVSNLDPKNYSDLLFFRLSTIASTFVKSCTIYGYVSNWIKYWRFRLKEKQLRSIPYEVMTIANTNRVHICSPDERAQLINEVASQYNISLNEIENIYKEYYTR